MIAHLLQETIGSELAIKPRAEAVAQKSGGGVSLPEGLVEGK